MLSVQEHVILFVYAYFHLTYSVEALQVHDQTKDQSQINS